MTNGQIRLKEEALREIGKEAWDDTSLLLPVWRENNLR